MTSVSIVKQYTIINNKFRTEIVSFNLTQNIFEDG